MGVVITIIISLSTLILCCLLSIVIFEFFEGWKAKIWYRKFMEMYEKEPFCIYIKDSNNKKEEKDIYSFM